LICLPRKSRPNFQKQSTHAAKQMQYQQLQRQRQKVGHFGGKVVTIYLPLKSIALSSKVRGCDDYMSLRVCVASTEVPQKCLYNIMIPPICLVGLAACKIVTLPKNTQYYSCPRVLLPSLNLLYLTFFQLRLSLDFRPGIWPIRVDYLPPGCECANAA
jgi:hypothetical protein